MADFWLLLRLRVKLAVRRYTGRPWVLAVSALAMLGMLAIGVWLGWHLAARRQRLDPALADNLLDLVALVASAFLVVNPLLGFRGNEFMDVTKLFHYPIRPAQVFLSSLTGHALSGSTLFLLPILVLPALAGTATIAQGARALALTLLLLFVLWAAVQCLTLLFLNVLRSRRFRDLVAIVAPVLGLLTYFGLRYVLGSRSGQSVEEILEAMQTVRFIAWLPPLWYSRAVIGGEPWTWVGPLGLGTLLLVLCWVGLRLTIAAFHGEIAIAGPRIQSSRATALGGALARLLPARLLPARPGAIYAKELALVQREPFFRVLFLQQIAFVILIGVGQGLWGSDLDAATTVYWSSTLLVLIESGFLQNSLGLEGPAIHQTAQLPVRGFTVLAGKNLAYLQVLALVDLVVVPTLAALGAYVSNGRFPIEPTVLALCSVMLVLPVVIGAGNIISVLLPNPIGMRGRRALGQERTGSEGCLAGLLRAVFSFVALAPATLVAGILALPVYLGHGLGATFFALCLPAGLLISVALWASMTLLAGRMLDGRLHRILERLG